MSFPRYECYKDSGIEWLGEVPEHWDIRRLKYNLRLLTEKTDRRENPVALENIESWSGLFIQTETTFEGEGIAFERGDILFGKLRPYLAKAYLAETSGEAVGDFHVMRPTKNTVGRFAQYQILNREFIAIVDGSTFGAKMPRASWDFMGGMVLTVPPITEQQTIGAFLDRETAKIDALIDEQKRLIELLKEKRQAVISHAVTKGLNPDAPMKDSGIEWLGKVPEHWDVLSIGKVTIDKCDGPFGSGLKSEHYTDAGVRVIRLQNIRQSGFDDTDAAFINENYYREKLNGHDVRQGDVLIAGLGDDRNTVGRACVAPDGIEPAMVKADCFRFRVLIERAQPEFVAMQLSAGSSFDAGKLSSGSTRSRIPLSVMTSRKIALPSPSEQQAIVCFLQGESIKFDALTTEAQTAIALLQERRAALISAAVTGKIDVRGLAAIQPEMESAA